MPRPPATDVHRPERFGKSHGGGKERDERTADILDQHRISIDVLPIGFELDALPRHDGAIARDIGRGQRLPNLLAIGRFGAVDRVGEDEQSHQFP